VEAQYGAFYTGGSICFTSDGKQCLCQNGSKINVVSIETLAIDVVIGESGSGDDNVQEDTIYTFSLSADDSTVVTAHRSGLLKLWNRETGNLALQCKLLELTM
jgi:WD40 repeat protein